MDTHILPKLTNVICQKCFAAVARSASGFTAQCERMRWRGVATRDLVAEQKWSCVRQRSGLTGPAGEVRTAARSRDSDGGDQARVCSATSC